MNTTKLGKYIINYNNQKEFHVLRSEIFGKDCYSMELSSKEPYILDIGAYIGLSVIYFKNLYPNSKILAFEPNPYAKEILEENIFDNGLENIRVLPYAIDSSEGKRNFFIDTSSNNWQSTAGFYRNSWNGEYENKTEITVETKKLSEYIKVPVDLLKIDIEGLEERVLSEAKKELVNVKNIVIEYHPIKRGNLSKILSLLKEDNFNTSIYKDGEEIKNIDARSLLIIKGTRV